jgi:hypothetical protein
MEDLLELLFPFSILITTHQSSMSRQKGCEEAKQDAGRPTLSDGDWHSLLSAETVTAATRMQITCLQEK